MDGAWEEVGRPWRSPHGLQRRDEAAGGNEHGEQLGCRKHDSQTRKAATPLFFSNRHSEAAAIFENYNVRTDQTNLPRIKPAKYVPE